MAPHLFGAAVRLAMVAVVVLSAALPAVAAAPPTANRERQHSARAARPRGNPVLAWGSWDQKRSQDQVTPRLSGNAKALSDETRVAAARYQQPVLDSSWTHAAFRAFHEMRAGCPPSSAVDGDREVQDEAGGGGGKGPLAGVRRLSSNLPRLQGARGGGAGGATTAASGGGGKKRTSRRRETSKEASAISSATAAAAVVALERGGESGGGERAPPKARSAPPACWHMQGRLTDAATGQTIALVEGVEMARSISFETASPRKSAGGKRRERFGGDRGPAGGGGGGGEGEAEGEEEELEVDKELKPGRWTAFGALASSKFFMYQDPATGEPMEHFRNTPVEKKQPVRTYERFSQVVSHLLQPNGRLLVVSEWGGRSVKAETANNNGVEEVEGGGGGFFSGGGGGGGGGGGQFGNGKSGRSLSVSSPSSSPRRVFNLHFFVEARTPKEERELKRWQDRPGARWIAFGSPPPPAHGCKEVYSYVTGRGGGRRDGSEADAGGEEALGKIKLPWLTKRERKNEADGGVAAGGSGDPALASASSSSSRRTGGGGGGGLMSYTRYGECPTWYGTGRMCGLDVQAKRVGSFASLPARLKQKVLEMDPDFEAGPPGTMAEVRRAAKKQRLEREEESRRKGRRSLRRPFGSWGSASSSGGDL